MGYRVKTEGGRSIRKQR